MPKVPSEKLRSLAASTKAKEFKLILETDLYPFLDRLPAAQQKSLLNILNNTGNRNESVELVGFDTRSNSISGGLKALFKSVTSDWKQGWEEQGEMMSELVGELCEWLPTLWKVGVEMGVEHALVHKSLKFCKKSHDALGNTNSRAEFSDLDPPERRFKDATGRVVYVGTSSTEHTILWVWRELLLSSIVHNPSDAVAKKIVTDMKKLKLTEEMLERLDDEILPAPKKLPKYGTAEYKNIDWELEDKQDLIQNAHWTPEMRAAVPKVKALFA